jgi:hypothetical protein
VRSPTEADPVRRLGRGSIAWRAAALLIGTYMVVHGTVLGDDGDWPFSPMSQFAFRTDPNDAIHATFLEARNSTGAVIPVSLSARSVGIARAEIEGQLPNIVRQPDLLRALAESYHRLHPGEPPLEQLWLRDRVTELDRGRPVGQHVTTLVGWPVNDAPPDNGADNGQAGS